MADKQARPTVGSTPTTTWIRRHRRLLTLSASGAVAVVMLFWGAAELTSPFHKRTSSTCDPADRATITTMTRPEVQISIYNAGAAPGTAGRFATRFTQLGFKVSTVGNAPTGVSIPVSEVVGQSPTDPAAKLVAATLGPSAKISSDPGLQLGPGVNVFLGPHHRAIVKHPPVKVRLGAPKVICLSD